MCGMTMYTGCKQLTLHHTAEFPSHLATHSVTRCGPCGYGLVLHPPCCRQISVGNTKPDKHVGPCFQVFHAAFAPAFKGEQATSPPRQQLNDLQLDWLAFNTVRAPSLRTKTLIRNNVTGISSF